MRFATAIAALLGMAACYGGGPLYTHQETSAARHFGATDITAAVLSADSTVWTGWIDASIVDDVVFDISLTDANSSIGSVTMRCETETDASTADDSGVNICSVAVAAGTATYTCPVTYSLATPGSLEWRWTVSDVAAPYINCLFTANAVVTASVDVLTVTVRGITP